MPRLPRLANSLSTCVYLKTKDDHPKVNRPRNLTKLSHSCENSFSFLRTEKDTFGETKTFPPHSFRNTSGAHFLEALEFFANSHNCPTAMLTPLIGDGL